MKSSSRKVVLAFIFCVAALVAPADAGDFGRLIHQKDSLYHRIFVYKSSNVVTLQFGRRTGVGFQGQVNLQQPRMHMAEYSELAFCALLYKPQPKRILVIGLGAGVFPREMLHYFPDIEIDIVEIDPEVPPIAKRFFEFPESDNIKVHIADGRMFVRRLLRRDPVPRYDIIMLDAFNSDYIPFHLMTKEFLEQVKGVLVDDGVVIANIFHANRLFDAELNTYLAAFGRTQVFLGVHSSNAIPVALGPAAPALTSKQALAKAEELQARHGFDFDMTTVAERFMPDITPDPRVKVLTDDCAPVNWLRTKPRSVNP